ncbi:sialate O-acetylesterase [Brachybacterium kimchii]|uniref:Sialate O-acetylesterase n=1 Tax=Brachybacterium kimchii TaxID=2942909 RepID=A0ABY4NB95_9MICO|nr:sialate O-acetylesterase [Brachybacterium kimchii]UQN30649.1 sialate O-acetylesterase [Brachybacterium kimchii]
MVKYTGSESLPYPEAGDDMKIQSRDMKALAVATDQALAREKLARTETDEQTATALDDIEDRLEATEVTLEYVPTVEPTDGEWMLAETDEAGKISRAVDAQARTWLRLHPDSEGVVNPTVAGEIQPLSVEGWAWAVTDETGQVALGVRTDGTAYTGDAATATQPYDVVLLIGQSNMKGQGQPSAVRDPWPGVDQYPAANKPEAGRILSATEPLLHQGPVTNATGTGLGIPFARRYRQEQPGRRILIVPSAWGATGFSTSAPAQGGTWDWTAPDDGTNLAINAVRQCKDALAAAGDGARLTGILWHQGEGDTGIADQYAAKLDGLIDWVREQLDAPDVPFVVGQMSPDRQGGAGGVTIDAAHQQTPARRMFTAFAPTPPGMHNPGDPTHLSTHALEVMGRGFFDALQRASFNRPGVGPIGPEHVRAHRSGDTVTVSWDAAWCRATDYQVEWRAPGGTWAATGVTHTPALGTTATLTATGPVEVRVTTINETGEATPVVTTA